MQRQRKQFGLVMHCLEDQQPIGVGEEEEEEASENLVAGSPIEDPNLAAEPMEEG